MQSAIPAIILGILLIVIGIFNTRGNISLLHSYHRKRVSEEDRVPFGKLVGLGNIIIGIAVIIYGGMIYAKQLLSNPILDTVANVILIVGLVIGLGISFYAMKKYNKGIF